jgi:hypothetical protein
VVSIFLPPPLLKGERGGFAKIFNGEKILRRKK